MISLLIADDEQGIIELIKNLLKPLRHSVQVIGEATDGNEAYRLLSELHPDLVITDIRMPGMTGLQLIERANTEFPQTAFIIISGYQEFEYAQAALKYGTADYLLKPIKQKELINVLLRLDRKKNVTEKQMSQLSDMEKQLSTTTGILRKSALQDLCSRQTQQVAHALAAFKNPDVFLQEAGWCCMARIILDDPLREGGEFSLDMAEALMQKILRPLQGDCIDTEYICNGAICSLYLRATEKQSSLEEKCAMLDCLVNNDSYKYEFFNITIAFGMPVYSTQELLSSYNTAIVAGRSRIDMGLNKVLLYSKLPDRIKIAADAPEQSAIEQLRKNIANLDCAATCNQIQQLFTQWRNSGKAGCGLYEMCEQLLDVVSSELENNASDFVCVKSADIAGSIESCATVLQLRDACISYTQKMISDCIAQQADKESRPIRETRQYIAQNYARQVTLEQIAEQVFMNPVYLSTVFKKETGYSFSSYLLQVRLTKARELLKEGKLSVAQIANEVGYQDVRYFSKLFTKNVGVKPNEYRKFYS